MKTLFVFSCMAALIVSLNACNKNSLDPATADGSARTSSVTSTSLTGPHNLTAVDVSSLPATITSYISTTYTGATIKEAKKDAAGNYVVAITVNSTVKLLLFKADGTFVKEFDGKRGHAPGDSAHHHMPGDSAHHHMPGDTTHHHMPGDSTHHHMPNDTTHRPKHGPGGPELTVVDVSSLPARITSYVSTNYAGATISKAGQNKETSDYVVIVTTSDNKHIALLFGSNGTFKKAFTGKK